MHRNTEGTSEWPDGNAIQLVLDLDFHFCQRHRMCSTSLPNSSDSGRGNLIRMWREHLTFVTYRGVGVILCYVRISSVNFLLQKFFRKIRLICCEGGEVQSSGHKINNNYEPHVITTCFRPKKLRRNNGKSIKIHKNCIYWFGGGYIGEAPRGITFLN